jgi:acetolactate synthase-1/2/3 large subunit
VRIADVLRSGEPAALLIGGTACGADGLRAASRISVGTGARVFVETFAARLERGAGLPAFEQLGYFAEQAQAQLDGIQHLIVAGTAPPVSFFAYPGRASNLVPEGAAVHVLAQPDEDVVGALTDLAERAAPAAAPLLAQSGRPVLPTGALTSRNWAEVVGALLPEGAIVSDEANTSGLSLPAATVGRRGTPCSG